MDNKAMMVEDLRKNLSNAIRSEDVFKPYTVRYEVGEMSCRITVLRVKHQDLLDLMDAFTKRILPCATSSIGRFVYQNHDFYYRDDNLYVDVNYAYKII